MTKEDWFWAFMAGYVVGAAFLLGLFVGRIL